MIRHFFLDKTNTISTNSERNMGLNPILGIGYGCGIMRGLIHFDLSEIKNLIDDKTFANIDKLTFLQNMSKKITYSQVSKIIDIIEDIKIKIRSNCNFSISIQVMALNIYEVIK